MLNRQFYRQFFLLRKQPLAATLSKTRPLISRRYVADQGMEISNQSETLKLFWPHSSVFLKNAKYLGGFFTSKKNLLWLLCVKGLHSLPENVKLNKV